MLMKIASSCEIYEVMIYLLLTAYKALNRCQEAIMAVSYERLWELLIDRKISKVDLRKASGIVLNTMTKLRRNEEVTLTVWGKICKVLEDDYGDIIEYVDKGDEE